jgi:hypothetical protein
MTTSAKAENAVVLERERHRVAAFRFPVETSFRPPFPAGSRFANPAGGFFFAL